MTGWPATRRGFLASAAALTGTALAGCSGGATSGGTASGENAISVGVLEDRSGNSALVGANHTSFYEQKASAGLEVPIGTSTAMAQGYEHLRLDPPAMANIYAGVNYMEEIPTTRNTEDGGFVSRYYGMWPDAPYLNEEAENNYFSIYMYKGAVEQVGTTDQAEVKEALESGIAYPAPETPEGEEIALDGPTHHVDHHMWAMRADEEHNVEAVDV